MAGVRTHARDALVEGGRAATQRVQGEGGGYVGGSVGADLTSLIALAILVAVLMVRPDGLFAGSRMRRV